MNHGLRAIGIFVFVFPMTGCGETSGIPYSTLTAGDPDADIVAANDRWQKIIADIDTVTAKPQESESTPSADEQKPESTDPLADDTSADTTNSKTPDSKVKLIALDRSDEAVFEIEPREPKLLIPSKSFFKDRRTGTVRVSYDDIDLLKILNMEPVPADAADMFPDWLSELNGKRIRIRGWMIPPPLETGLKGFSLARDNGICCFIRQPKVYDVLEVTMRDGETTNFINGRPFDVEGVLRIDPIVEFGELYQLYFLDDAIVVQR